MQIHSTNYLHISLALEPNRTQLGINGIQFLIPVSEQFTSNGHDEILCVPPFYRSSADCRRRYFVRHEGSDGLQDCPAELQEKKHGTGPAQKRKPEYEALRQDDTGQVTPGLDRCRRIWTAPNHELAHQLQFDHY